MVTRVRACRGLAAGVLVGLLVTGAAVAAPTRLPTLKIMNVTVDRIARTVDVRLRICFTPGPRALIRISERRTLNGIEKASHRWIPRGVEPARISPYACNNHWRMNWLLAHGLSGPGTYSATIRLRDAYGRWTRRASFSVTST